MVVEMEGILPIVDSQQSTWLEVHEFLVVMGFFFIVVLFEDKTYAKHLALNRFLKCPNVI